MDQTEPENQNIPWYFKQCRAHSDMDRFVRLPPSRFPEIQSQTGQFHAADAEIITFESV